MIVDHECPACKTTLGVLKSVGVKGDILEDGVKKNVHSVCAVCGNFLRIVEMRGGRAQVQSMTAEEILELPDAERITMQRLANVLAGRKPAELKEAITRHAKMSKKMAAAKGELTQLLDEHVTRLLGDDVGCILILKDLRPDGAQATFVNMHEKLAGEVLQRALADYDGTIEKVMKELFGE